MVPGTVDYSYPSGEASLLSVTDSVVSAACTGTCGASKQWRNDAAEQDPGTRLQLSCGGVLCVTGQPPTMR